MLRGGPSALRIGKNVQGVRAGRRRALRQAARDHVQLRLVGALPRGRAARPASPATRSITSAVTFSTDIAPIVRAGLVPAFVDVEPDTFHIDVDGIEAMIAPAHQGDPRPEPHRQLPRLGPHPRHRRRARPQGDRGLVRRARRQRCGARRPAPAPTSASPASPSSHIITAAGTGGMVCFDDDELVDRCAAAAPVGPALRAAVLRLEEGRQALLLRRSTASSTTTCSSSTRSGWNFEPSESVAAFGVVQLDKLPRQPRPPPAQLRPAVGVLRHLPRRVHAAAPRPRARDRVAHVPDPDPARVGHPPGRVPGAHGGPRRRHPHGVDGQRHPPARVRRRAAPRPGGRAAQRRPGHGAGPDPAAATTGSTTTTSSTSCVTAGRFLQEHGFAPAGVAS